MVQDRKLRPVRAVDELLVDLPADRAHVAVLADRLLHENTVVAETLHNARPILEVEISCKLETSFQGLLDCVKSHVSHVVVGFEAANRDEVIVELIVKEASVGNRAGLALQTANEDAAVAVEV